MSQCFLTLLEESREPNHNQKKNKDKQHENPQPDRKQKLLECDTQVGGICTPIPPTHTKRHKNNQRMRVQTDYKDKSMNTFFMNQSMNQSITHTNKKCNKIFKFNTQKFSNKLNINVTLHV